MLRSSNSLTHYAKGTRSHAKGAPTACRHAVSGSISLPCQGCFSPFPHGTGSLSVACVYLALEDGPPRFRQDITCPIVLRCLSAGRFMTSDTGLSPSMAGFPVRFPVTTRTRSSSAELDERSYNPDMATTAVLAPHRFGLFPVRSPLLRESLLISIPPVTKMFQFTGLSPQRLCIQRWVGLLTWVSPFGNLWIIA